MKKVQLARKRSKEKKLRINHSIWLLRSMIVKRLTLMSKMMKSIWEVQINNNNNNKKAEILNYSKFRRKRMKMMMTMTINKSQGLIILKNSLIYKYPLKSKNFLNT